MRRWILPALAVSLLTFALNLWATGGLAAVGTQPGQAVRVMDGQHTQLLRVDHTGAIPVTCQTAAGVAESCAGTSSSDAVNVFHQSTIRHVSSVSHVAAADGGFVIRDPINAGARARVDHTGALVTSATVTTDTVNVFHQSTVRHVSSVTHIAAADGGFVIRDPINTGARARVDHTGALVTSATVTVTTDNVNVFHQSTIRHISSVTHVNVVGWSFSAHVQQGAAGQQQWPVAAHLVGIPSISQGTAWAVTAHQGGQWSVAHISSAIHVAGTINGAAFHVQGLGIPGQAHGGVLTIQGVAGGVPVAISGSITAGDAVNVFHQSTVRHVSSVTHVRLIPSDNANDTVRVHGAMAQSGTWTVQAAHQGGEWNIRHLGAEVHVLIRVPQAYALHVAAFQGGSWSVQAAHQGGEWNIRHVSGLQHVVIVDWQRWAHIQASQSGTWTVAAAHQGGEWNVRHLSSVAHVVLVQAAHINLAPGATFPVQQGFAGQQAWPVTAHQGGQWNVNHITSVSHVQGAIRLMGATPNNQLATVTHFGALAVTCYTSTGTTESCGGTGGSGDAVNVFHQSTVRHVSSVLHARLIPSDNANDIVAMHLVGPFNRGLGALVAHGGGLYTVLSNAAGTLVTVTGTALDVNCTGCSAASVVAVSHISAAVHIAGTINGAQLHVQGLGTPGQSHGGVLTVQGIAGMNPVVERIVSAPNVGLGAIVTHTGELLVNCTTGCSASSSDTVNVFHQSTIRHVSSLTHVVIVDWQRWAHIQASQSGSWTVQAAHLTGVPSVSQGSAWAVLAHAQQSGTWTIQAAHQGGEWNIGHLSSVTHVVLVQAAHINLAPGATFPVQQGAAGLQAWPVSAHQAGQSNGIWRVDHVTSVLHVVLIQSAHINLAPSATFPVQQGFAGQQQWPISAHQAGQSGGIWRIDHITSILHVSIIQGGTTGANHLLVAPVYQAGTWTVQPGNTPNTTAWLANIQHISSVVHVSLRQGTGTGADHLLVSSTIVNSLAPRITIAHITSTTHVSGLVSVRDDNCLTCRMRVDHYNVLVVQPHISGALRTWQVSQCGTTASLAINTNANRRDLWVMNRGNGNIYIGYGTTGHVALTTANGWPLHATASAITTVARHSTALSTVYLQNYQGPLACISDLAGQTLQVMEILR